MKTINTIIFDVFGTLLDWKGTIISEGLRLFPHLSIDWEAFAVEWMKSYGRSVNRLQEWRNLDSLLIDAYGPLAERYQIECESVLKSRAMSTVWNRLNPWLDAVSAFPVLSESFLLGAFTNANIDMLEALTNHSKLQWDYLFSAESVKKYKPDPSFYLMALDELRRKPDEVLLVASHTFDLNAANQLGIQTALIVRPGEPNTDPSGLIHKPLIVTSDLNDFADFMLEL